MLINRLIFQLQSDFEKEMGSLGSDDVLTESLSRGAKIRRIFHKRLAFKLFSIEILLKLFAFFRLPEEISKIQNDEDKLRHKIENAIENVYGFNGVLNTPFKAFEALVKEQIELLEDPIKVCIDLVVDELSSAVRNCTKNVNVMNPFNLFVEKFGIN